MQFDEAIPGADLVNKGLIDLACNRQSVEALLVLIARPWFESRNIPIPKVHLADDAEMCLYALLEEQDAKSAYSRYNALLRRLVSFEHIADYKGGGLKTGIITPSSFSLLQISFILIRQHSFAVNAPSSLTGNI